jgi:hypothetical protein
MTPTESDSRGSIVPLASGLLSGLAALVLALLSQRHPLVAVGGYALLIGTAGLGFVITGQGSDRSERADRIGAADVTLAVVGVASGVVFPGLVLAAGLGYFRWTPVAAGIAFSVAGLYALYGTVALGQWLRTRPA